MHTIDHNNIIDSIIRDHYNDILPYIQNNEIIIECPAPIKQEIHKQVFNMSKIKLYINYTESHFMYILNTKLTVCMNNNLPEDWIIIGNEIFELNNNKTPIV